MNKKVGIIVLISFSFILMLSLFVKKGTKAYMTIDNNYYPVPIISYVNIEESKAIINAGMYYYDDLNLDGIIDETDVQFMNSLLSGTLTFTDEQKALVDFDKDKEITNNDLEELRKYVGDNYQITYNTYSDKLDYCVIKDNDSSKCKWNKKNMIKIDEYDDYYAFVRLSNSDKISNGYKFKNQIISVMNGKMFGLK